MKKSKLSKTRQFIINNIAFAIPIIFFVLGFILVPKPVMEKIIHSSPIQIFKSHEEKIFDKYKNYIFGIDVSHYQNKINWSRLGKLPDNNDISFVFVRASVGSDTEDRYFKYNWEKAKAYGYIRGAYHYYRPDENSISQADNFISIVHLQKGDLPPVLDIEKESSIQSMARLKQGLKKWLDKVEKHYGMTPIIYTGDTYYRDFLNDTYFRKYKFWIANYNKVFEPNHNQWIFWQFTQNGKLKGINHKVDFNVFRGNINDLLKITKK